jgi:hypothetical protein
MSDMPPTIDPYADCRNAIAFVEKWFRESPSGVAAVRDKIGTVDAFLRAAIDPQGRQAVPQNKETLRLYDAAMPEFMAPSFRRYLLGRVWGAM